MNIHLIPLAGYCFFQPFRPFELHGGGKIDLVILFFLVRIRNDFFVFRMTARKSSGCWGPFCLNNMAAAIPAAAPPKCPSQEVVEEANCGNMFHTRLPYRKVTSNDRATKGTCLRRMPLKNRKKASE